MSASEIRNLLNLFESIILNELTDKVKQQQFERLKSENNAKIDQLVLQYNKIQQKKSEENDLIDIDAIDFDDHESYNEMDRIRQEIEKEKKNLIPDEKIRMYIDLWDEYSQGFPQQFKDITKLSLDQIIRITRDADFRKYISGKKNRFFTNEEPNAELDTLYNKNNLTIMKGDLREKCIRYGDGYSWCISRKDAQNMFYSYRMRMGEPMFYFVFDKDKPKEDIYHAIVIYVDNQDIFKVATSNNPGDVQMTWDEIIQKQPKLTGLEGIFKHKPLTPEEKADYKKYKNMVSDETYDNFSLEEKYKYFKFGHSLTDNQQDLTPDELIGVYAKLMPTKINNKTWKRLKSGDKRKIITDVIDENNNISPYDFYKNVLKNFWHLSELPKEIVKKDKNGENIVITREEIIVKAHNKIATDSSYSYNYAQDIIRETGDRSLVPDIIVKGIATDSFDSYNYAQDIIRETGDRSLVPDIIVKGIATNSSYSYNYAQDIIRETDDRSLVPDIILKGIATNSYYSYKYVKDILEKTGDRSLVPDIILKGIASNSSYSYNYAKDIIRETDDISLVPDIIVKGIASNSYYSYDYAKDILEKTGDRSLVPDIILKSIKQNEENYNDYKNLISNYQTESIDLSRLKTLSGIK